MKMQILLSRVTVAALLSYSGFNSYGMDGGKTVAELAACDESGDFALYLPFKGPLFADDGTLWRPLPDSHLVSTTAGWAKQDADNLARVIALNTQLMAELFKLTEEDGFYGAGFGGSEKCDSSRTLTFWRDVEAMRKFVRGESHRAAIRIMPEATNGWETMHWLEANPNVVATFDDARARFDEKRRGKK